MCVDFNTKQRLGPRTPESFPKRGEAFAYLVTFKLPGIRCFLDLVSSCSYRRCVIVYGWFVNFDVQFIGKGEFPSEPPMQN